MEPKKEEKPEKSQGVKVEKKQVKEVK